MWPEVSASSIEATAREYLGTPWHHDARLKGVGIDCTGLLVCVLTELGVPVEDHRGYGMGDEIDRLLEGLGEHCDPLEEGAAEWPGDILVYRGRLMWHHCGFRSAGGMIHSYASPSVMRVVEQPLDESWFSRLHSVWRYKGAVN